VLSEKGWGTEEVFLRGVRHVQMEGSWGGPVDVAGELRAVSGVGLAAVGSREALTELADLLMDPLPGCRMAAARGIGLVGSEWGALALRVKLLAGDEEIGVVEECLAALVKVGPRRAVGFVARMLDHEDEEVRGAAAVALGMTREREGLKVLLERWEREIAPEGRRRLLPAIALARLPEAVDFLVGLVEEGHRSVAGEAVEALGPYRHDAQVRGRVSAAVERRGETGVRERFEAVFGR
jgi:HEAT repeat protein